MVGGSLEDMKEGALWVIWGNSVLGGESGQSTSPWRDRGQWAGEAGVQQAAPGAEA